MTKQWHSEDLIELRPDGSEAPVRSYSGPQSVDAFLAWLALTDQPIEQQRSMVAETVAWYGDSFPTALHDALEQRGLLS